MTRARSDGVAAETLARRFLEQQGLEFVQSNFNCRFGVIDLVMRKGDTVVVAEVRKRSHRGYGSAAESVTAGKQRRIVQATRALIAQQPALADCDIRFDVIGIDADNQVDWIPSAFEGF